MKNTLKIVILFIVLLGFPQLAKWIAFSFDYTAFDPENVFLKYMVRHTLQALFILVLILLFKKKKDLDFGLTFGNSEIGLNYMKKFILIFLIGSFVNFFILYLTSQIQPYNFTYNFKNIIGYLAFQLIFTGPSEEIIFRAFSITIFNSFISNKYINKKISYANLFSIIIFGIAHIGISFSSFQLSYSIPQIIFSMILGYFYGDCYEKTRSIYYPMLMHSIGNIVIVTFTLIFSGLF